MTTATFPLLSRLEVLFFQEEWVRKGEIGDGDVRAGRHLKTNFSTQPAGIFGLSLHQSFVCFCAGLSDACTVVRRHQGSEVTLTDVPRTTTCQLGSLGRSFNLPVPRIPQMLYGIVRVLNRKLNEFILVKHKEWSLAHRKHSKGLTLSLSSTTKLPKRGFVHSSL